MCTTWTERRSGGGVTLRAAATLEPMEDDEGIPQDELALAGAGAEAGAEAGGAPLDQLDCHTAWLQRETRKHLQRALQLDAQEDRLRQSLAGAPTCGGSVAPRRRTKKKRPV